LPGGHARERGQHRILITGVKLIKQPQGQPWWIGLNLGATIGTTDGTKPSPLSNLVFLFPHATVNADAFPTCTVIKLKAHGAKGCPRGSRLGQGTSLINASPLLNPAHADITMFNGPRSHGNPTFLFMAQAKEVQVKISFYDGQSGSARTTIGCTLSGTPA
jgi:hypothetical protein